MSQKANPIATVFYGVAFLTLGVGGFGCMLTIGVQIYRFLRDGFWVQMPALTKFGELFGSEWMLYPMDWLGLHNMLNSLNSGVMLFAVCAFIYGVFFSFAENMSKPRNERQIGD